MESTSQIRVASLRTAISMRASEIQNVRGAIIELVVKNRLLFESNHISLSIFSNHFGQSENNFIYRYPVIQYKIYKGNRKGAIGFALITGIGQGADALNILAKLHDQPFKMNNRQVTIGHHELRNSWVSLGLITEPVPYRIYRWMAFQKENYERFMQLNRLSDRLIIMEQALKGHIDRFYKDSGIPLPEGKLEVWIRSIGGEKWIPYKNAMYLTFDLVFYTNVVIPHDLGLGNSVSIGFGKTQLLPVHNNMKVPGQLMESIAEY